MNFATFWPKKHCHASPLPKLASQAALAEPVEFQALRSKWCDRQMKCTKKVDIVMRIVVATHVRRGAAWDRTRDPTSLHRGR